MKERIEIHYGYTVESEASRKGLTKFELHLMKHHMKQILSRKHYAPLVNVDESTIQVFKVDGVGCMQVFADMFSARLKFLVNSPPRLWSSEKPSVNMI